MFICKLFVDGSVWSDMSAEFNESKMLGLDEYASDPDLAAVPLFKDYPEPLLKFAGACCIIYMLIGIPGNLITIIALSKYKKVRNATSIFIISLSCSDLLFCCFNLPLAASTFFLRSWTHGRFLCRLFPMARYALVAVSLFTVLAITINRYIIIARPLWYTKLYTDWSVAVMIAVMWITPFGFLFVTYFEVWGQFSLNSITGSCTIIPDDHGHSPKKFLFIAAFAFPSVAIIVCYALILWMVRKTARKSKGSVPIKPLKSMPEITSEALESSIQEVQKVKKKIERPRTVPCFNSPEISSSYDSSSEEKDKSHNYAPEFRSSAPNSERAKKIRKSFAATFRRSTAYIKPRLPTNRDKKLLTMIVAILSSFLVCHLPITLTKTIFEEISFHPYSNIAGYVLIYLTTCINPVIYVVMSKEYRKAYKNLFNCR